MFDIETDGGERKRWSVMPTTKTRKQNTTPCPGIVFIFSFRDDSFFPARPPPKQNLYPCPLSNETSRIKADPIRGCRSRYVRERKKKKKQKERKKKRNTNRAEYVSFVCRYATPIRRSVSMISFPRFLLNSRRYKKTCRGGVDGCIQQNVGENRGGEKIRNKKNTEER